MFPTAFFHVKSVSELRGLKKARQRTDVHQNEVQLDQFWHGSLRFLMNIAF